MDSFPRLGAAWLRRIAVCVSVIMGGCVLKLDEGNKEHLPGRDTSSLRPNPTGSSDSEARSNVGEKDTTQSDQGSVTSSSENEDIETVPLPESLLFHVQQDAKFSTLRDAIAVAQMEAHFVNKVPHALLAPTNEGFAKLPRQKRDSLFADKAKMRDFLLTHLIKWDYRHKELQRSVHGSIVYSGTGPRGETSVGTQIGDGGLIWNPAVKASNGELYELEGFLLPMNRTVFQVLSTRPQWSTFLEASKMANLDRLLDPKTSYTVFVPDNDAFEALSARMGATAYEALMRDKAKVTVLVKQHIHGDLRARSSFLGGNENLSSLQSGFKLQIRSNPERSWEYWVNGRAFGEADETDLTAIGAVLHQVKGTLHDGDT